MSQAIKILSYQHTVSWNEGYGAHETGQKLSDNPHLKGERDEFGLPTTASETDECYQWIDGWRAAYRKWYFSQMSAWASGQEE